MPDSLPARLLLRLIAAYRFLPSHWVGSSCRYWPTCSEYAKEAIELHGAARGSYLAARRLGRCHPYGRGGVDPVPQAFCWRCRCEEAPGAPAGSLPADASRDA
jgi:uncharacterized protein